MKKLLIIIVLCNALICNAQLTKVHIDMFNHDGSLPSLAGFTSIRIFAQTESPEDYVVEVTGTDVVCTSTVCTDGTWFNSDYAGDNGRDNNILFWSLPGFQDSRFDTYYTIGYSSNATLGIPQIDDSDGDDFVGDLAIDLSTSINTAGNWATGFSVGNQCIVDLSGEGGAWFALPGDANALGVGVNNSVLLVQFTTNGDYNHKINISVIPIGDNLISYTYCDDAALIT